MEMKIFVMYFIFHATTSQNNTAIHLSLDSTLDTTTNIRNDMSPRDRSLLMPFWSEWSTWTKCRKCVQKRTKFCTNGACNLTKLLQQRRCKSWRCRRRKSQDDVHIVMPEKKSSTEMGSISPWGSWTIWSICSKNCRTYRRRYCKKLKYCNKRRQVQYAYCYRGKSSCQRIIFKLMQHTDGNTGYAKRTSKLRNIMGSSMKCGIQYKTTLTNKMLRILGGNESSKHQWPWHVALLNSYSEVYCGGTLIAPQWVLTAGHCVRQFLIVRLNEHDLNRNERDEIEMLILKIYQHPHFNPNTVNGDIALLQLPIAVRTTVACLPNKKPITGQMCSVMGWGKTKSHARRGAMRLREAQIPIVGDAICKWAYKDLIITDSMFCAGWISGKSDTCAGDSGGGLMCPYEHTTNGHIMYSIQGITSFGKGCGKRNKFGIYTVVYNYIDWISYIINSYTLL